MDMVRLRPWIEDRDLPSVEDSMWEVLLRFDSKVAVRVSGTAETVYYFR